MVAATKKGKEVKAPKPSKSFREVGKEFRAAATELLAQCKTALNYPERMRSEEFEFLEQLVERGLDKNPSIGTDLQRARELVTRILGAKSPSSDQADRELLERLRECLHQIHSRDRDYDLAGRLINQASFASDEERVEARRIVDVYGDFSRDESPPAKPTNGKASRNGKHGEASPANTWGEVFEVDLGLIDRHPENREPTIDEIQARAESMKTEQLEEVRIRIRPGGRFQMLSGETRWKAAKLLKWKKIRARAIDCTDAQARLYLIRFNAQRSDINPIQKAKHILKLCEPADKGGNGLTREQAAAEVGIESVGGASNLVRLLELPEIWQQRVISGELPQSFARLLIPYANAPHLVEAIEQDWQNCHKKGAREWEREEWQHRDDLAGRIDHIVAQHTRPIDAKIKIHGYTWQQVGTYNSYGRLFELTKELREQLDVVTLEVDGKKREVATNVKLFDQLQIPLIKKKAGVKKSKNEADEDGARATPAKARKPTAAELRAREKEKAEQLTRRIQAWRHQWLKPFVAQAIERQPAIVLRILIWMSTNPLGHFDLIGLRLRERIAGKAKEHGASASDVWRALGQLGADAASLTQVGQEVARCVIAAEDRDGYRPRVDFSTLEELASIAGLDVAELWKQSQAKDSIGHAHFVEFFELHQTAQLDELGDELMRHVRGQKDKATRVKIFTVATSCPVRLPKSIKPLAAAKAAKKGK